MNHLRCGPVETTSRGMCGYRYFRSGILQMELQNQWTVWSQINFSRKEQMITSVLVTNVKVDQVGRTGTSEDLGRSL